MTELETKIDQVAELVSKAQDKFTELEAQGKTNSEGFEKLTEAVANVSKEFQDQKAAIEAETKARQDLELSLARKPEASDGKAMKGSPEYQRAFRKYLFKGTGAEPGLEERNAEAEAYIKMLGIEEDDAKGIAQVKALVIGSNPDLGYTVGIDESRIISERLFETSPMRGICTVITTAMEAVEVIIDDEEPGSEWVAETDSSGDTTTPGIASLEIPTHEQQAMPKATLKMLEDSSWNVESWLSNKVSDRFSRQENNAFVLGDGIKKATGFTTYAAWANNEQYERGKLARHVTATSNTLAGDDLIALQTLLLEGYQNNARWGMNRKTWGSYVITLKDTTGQYLINPQLIYQGVDLQLLGKPVTLLGDMASSLDDNELIIAYGDWREAYTIVDRIGLTVLRDPYTSKGFVKYFTRKRTGGDVTNYQALKLLEVKA